jgi:hypothetical protein
MRRGWKACGGALLWLALAAAPLAGQSTPGVPPRDATRCPDAQPIKGYASTRGEGSRVYYVPGSPQYDRANPERCFATEQEARDAGYRAARGDRPPDRR